MRNICPYPLLFSSITYDGASRQILLTDALGNSVAYVFDGNGNAVQATRTDVFTGSEVPNESFLSAAFYDCLNRQTVTAMQGPDGSFVPSRALGGPVTWTTLGVGAPAWCTATGTIFSFAGYDSRGNATLAVDPKGNSTIAEYDGASRRTETQQLMRLNGDGGAGPEAGGSFLPGSRAVIRTETVYDGNSRVIALIDDRGATTSYAYDLLDRQITMTFQDGSTRAYGYNLASDVIQFTDENGSVFANTFDSLGRRTAVAITPATGVATGSTTAQSFQYDGLSRLTMASDIAGSNTAAVSLFYDSLNRIVEEDQTYGPTGSGTTYYVTHDKFTSYPVTELTYPNMRLVNYGYDLLYRRNAINETSPAASIAAWQFFGNRIVECVLGNSLICTQLNNARTNSMVQSPDVPNPAWGDQSSDRLGYDGSGRMITKRFLAGGINGDTGAYNNTTSLVGFTTSYDPSSNKLFERALHTEFEVMGQSQSRSALYPSYDSINRLLEYDRGMLASGGGSITTPITLPGTDSQRSYDLDHLGNWKNTAYTPVAGSPTTEVRRHNLVNQITKFASTPVTYDHGNNSGNPNPIIAAQGNGNIVNDGTLTYAYDALNRLINVSCVRSDVATPIASYTYDALGRRLLKVVTNNGLSDSIADATYQYLYDGNQIVEELLVADETATTLRQFVWGQYIDELVQLSVPTTTTTPPLTAGVYYPLQDMLYRTTATTNSSGAIVEAYDYDAYGNTLMYSGPGTDGLWFTDDDVTTLQPMCEYLFTGRQYDPETEIYWYRARYYAPQIGRFTQRDPRNYLNGFNLFWYVMNNPAVLADPSGTQANWPLPYNRPGTGTGPGDPNYDLQWRDETWERYKENLAEGNTSGARYWKGESEKWDRQYKCNCKKKGVRVLRIRITWAINPTAGVQRWLDGQMQGMRESYAHCCVKVEFSFHVGVLAAGANTGGSTTSGYSHDLLDLAGNFDTSGGTEVPIIINNSVTDTGGITLASRYDASYSGPSGAVVPIQGSNPYSLAHEVGHVAGLEHTDDAGDVRNLMGGGPNVTNYECNQIRALANPS